MSCTKTQPSDDLAGRAGDIAAVLGTIALKENPDVAYSAAMAVAAYSYLRGHPAPDREEFLLGALIALNTCLEIAPNIGNNTKAN